MAAINLSSWKYARVFSLLGLLGLFGLTIFTTSCERSLKDLSEGSSMTTAVFETSKGSFTVELYAEEMPLTTQNFISLAQKEFYDGTRFHRVIGEFMIQGGDPLTKNESLRQFWGTGGPGHTIKDEFTAVNRNDRGTISMANAGPHTGGSQFFINVVNNNFLDSKHPVFGKVIGGINVVDAISHAVTNAQDQPAEDVVVYKITIQ